MWSMWGCGPVRCRLWPQACVLCAVACARLHTSTQRTARRRTRAERSGGNLEIWMLSEQLSV